MRQREVLAYTAGIVDGEGCITIASGNKLKGKQGNRLTLDVSVTNTKEWLCQWLRLQYGGAVRLHSPETINRAECWRWRICSRQAMDFLKLILPYLQIKRPQAEIAIRFQSRKKHWGRNHIDTEHDILQEADKILISSYNHKPIKDGPTITELKPLLSSLPIPG